jgi:hypothetical protein
VSLANYGVPRVEKEHWVRGMMMTIFWDVTSCSLVEVNQRFRNACCRHHQGDYRQTTRRNMPEDSHLHIRHRENLISHLEE